MTGRNPSMSCRLVKAIGGTGKSALTWEWVRQQIESAAGIDYAGIIWWSFYEQQLVS